MRWWFGRWFVGYSWKAARWGFVRRETLDGHQCAAVCFGTLAVGVGWK